MGWEERAGRRYFYRKRRHGRRVCSEYVGSGQLAEAIAALDAIEREQSALARIEEQDRCSAQGALDALLDQFLVLTRMIASDALVAQGYRQHHGQWRKKRND
jgi:hypothetical protein